MHNQALFSLLLVVACSKGDAQPAPTAKPTEPTPAPAPKPAEKPAPAKPLAAPAAAKAKSSARDLGLAVMKAIGAKKDIPFELDRKFVSITIDPATDKRTVKAFCGDDNMKAWQALPNKIANDYAARVAAALRDPDQGIPCAKHAEKLIYCEVSPQDEHEKALTFLIAEESWGPVLAGYAERETWMIDPDSPRFAKDLAARDAALARATTDDCFKPESSRRREEGIR